MLPDEVSALFSTHHDRIYRYVLTFVHESSDAQDLTQETFLRAYSRRDQLHDSNTVRGWLYRIATRACLDRLRQSSRAAKSKRGEDSSAIDLIPSTSPSPWEVAERKQTGACVQRCLDFLSDRYRAVILLHEAHSLTAAEIAELLGENVGTIKIRLHRARHKLQEIMQIGCAVSQSTSGVPCCEVKMPQGMTEHELCEMEFPKKSE